MRNFLSAIIVGLLLMGCSVDNDDTIVNNDQLLTANSILEVDGCESVIYDLNSNKNNSVGHFVITNDKDNLYLNFSSNSGFLITEIVWEVVSNLNNLPANNGGIIPGQLENKKDFNPGTNYHGETVALSGYENLDEVMVVAKVTFINPEQQKSSVWVGNEILGKKESKFLYYSICEPMSEPVCEAYAGANNSVTYTNKEVDAIVETQEDVENLYKDLLEEGVSRNGTFNPTIKQILKSYYTVSKYQDFQTVYTVTNQLNGVTCSDSVELTLTITR